MHPYMEKLVEGIGLPAILASEGINGAQAAFLAYHGYAKTAAHHTSVARTARRLAIRFGAKPEQAITAGLLHDISTPIPNERRLEAAQALGLEVLPEEVQHPLLLHQKLSAIIAKDLFGVQDTTVLSAIGCHTTLKAGASVLDKIVFVADKLAWDQSGEPPYAAALREALEDSLDRAALTYLKTLQQPGGNLSGPLHPWAWEALQELGAHA